MNNDAGVRQCPVCNRATIIEKEEIPERHGDYTSRLKCTHCSWVTTYFYLEEDMFHAWAIAYLSNFW